MRVIISIASGLVLLAMLSLILELTPTGADKAFIALLIVAAFVGLIANVIYSKYDKTNGNDSGLIAFFLMIMGDGVVCLVTSLLILFGVIPFGIGVAVASGIIIVWTILLTHGLVT